MHLFFCDNLHLSYTVLSSKLTRVTAAIAAVSARSIFEARDTEEAWFKSIINCLSFSEKSPSGPIRMHMGPSTFFDNIFLRLPLSQLISQKIIRPFFGKVFKKFFKESFFDICGKEIRFDCSLDSIIIFFNL